MLIVLIDQGVKRLVTGNISLGESYPLIPGVLDLSYRRNTGAAFSIMHTAPPAVMIVISLLVLGIFLWLTFPNLASRGGMAAISLIMGGALGNLIDRVRLNYVIDYIDIHVWPVFNVADAAVVIGVCVLGIVLIVSNRSNIKMPTGESL